MDFINKLLTKLNKLDLTSKEESSPVEYPVIRTNGKEIKYNPHEEKKVVIKKQPETFEFSLQINGKTIFQNLILTASANQNGQALPIKCKWRRIHGDTIIFIKDINGFSYMPNAEDIGYHIEVEVQSLDNPNDVGIASYGPIVVEKDMQNALELLLTSGQTQFTLNAFDTNSQEQRRDQELTLYLNNDELKLVEFDNEKNEKVLERCKYMQFNPIIKLSNTNVTKFTLKFRDFSADEDDERCLFNNKNEEIVTTYRKEYELLAMSKQCRELIYLIIQFFIIDERMKNSKIFQYVNYSTLPSDVKLQITDLQEELKTTKEENTMIMQNMKYLQFLNKKLNEDMKNLEEDFQITLSQINGSDIVIKESLNRKSKINLINGSGYETNEHKNNGSEWKKKCEELNGQVKSLAAKEKALKDEKIDLLGKVEENKSIIDKNINLIENLKGKKSSLENDLNILKKKLEESNKENCELKNKLSENEERKSVKSNKSFNDKYNKAIKELENLKKTNESLKYENKNLIQQRNIFSNQKQDLSKELEKNRKEIVSLQEKIKNINAENYEKKIKNLEKNNQQLKDDYSELLNKYDILKLENQNVMELYEKSKQNNNNFNEHSLNMSMSSVTSSVYQLSPEEFEEYDKLKKNKDENEALIMQLKSNCEAREVQIEELKKEILRLKKNK